MAGRSKSKATGDRKRAPKAKTRRQPDRDDSSGEGEVVSFPPSSAEHSSSEPGSHSKKRGRGKQAAKDRTADTSESQPWRPTVDAVPPLPSFSRSQTVPKSESSQLGRAAHDVNHFFDRGKDEEGNKKPSTCLRCK